MRPIQTYLDILSIQFPTKKLALQVTGGYDIIDIEYFSEKSGNSSFFFIKLVKDGRKWRFIKHVLTAHEEWLLGQAYEDEEEWIEDDTDTDGDILAKN